MDIIEEKGIAFPHAKKLLERKAKERELGYEQNNALEYLKKFSKLSVRKADEILKELNSIEKLRDRHKILIVNTLPEDMDDMRLLFAHEVVNLSEDDKKKIISIVKKFA